MTVKCCDQAEDRLLRFAVIIARSGGKWVLCKHRERDTLEIPGELGENHTFSARLTCALSDGINISVVFITGGVRETQLLETYSGLYVNSLPDVGDTSGPRFAMVWKDLNVDGALDFTGEYANFRRQGAETAALNEEFSRIGKSEVKTHRVGLFRNQKLLGWLTPCEQPANYRGFEDCDFYQFPAVSVVPQPEDVFTVTSVVTDEYGREFVIRGIPYGLDPETGRLSHLSGGMIGIDDPDGWEY